MVPNQARVVIIGGGIMGVSLLYHLAKDGWADCVLLEKAELTSGSTWHAAGQITHSTSSYTLGKIAGYGISLYRQLEAETGQSVSFHDCGSLRLAYTADELDWLRYTMSVGAALGHPMRIIGVDEIRRLHPFYNLDGVRAALHTPDDGHVNPAGATLALAKGAQQMEATTIRRCLATDISPRANGAWCVHTEHGHIDCEIVVNAGGNYARQIGQWVGLNLPITCMTHHYLVTDTVPEFKNLDRELPVVRDDRMVSGYIRMEQRSGLIGIYEKANPNTVWLDGTPWDAENELFEADYERIMPWLESAMRRMPVLAELGIKREIHGAITHPPDGNMLLGPAPGLPNFWCCCGSQIGIAWGPGAGKYLAQWMVHGAADINMREFDPRRYGAFADTDYAITKAKEDYLLRHEIPFPGLNRTDGRPVKTSPIYQHLKQSGAVFEEIFGWERARWFARGDIPQQDDYSFRRAAWHHAVATEVDAVQHRAGLMDLSSFAKIDVYGTDAEDFVNRVIANTAPKSPGRIVLAHILNERGTIESETTVVRIDEQRFYFVFAAFHELRVFEWLNRYRRDSERISIDNVSTQFGVLALQGPRARDILSETTATPLDNAAFPWLRAQSIEVAGVPTRALRLSYSGELGWELHMPISELATVYNALRSAGEPYGVENYGSFAMNSMRLEKMFKAASELTTEVTLPEAGVMRFAKTGKSEFIGREPTLASSKGMIPWVCAYLRVECEDADCHGSEAVFANGQCIGAVSSGGFGHRTQQSLAFAYIKPEYARPDAELEVMVLGERRPAQVLAEAVYDADNRRPRM